MVGTRRIASTAEDWPRQCLGHWGTKGCGGCLHSYCVGQYRMHGNVAHSWAVHMLLLGNVCACLRMTANMRGIINPSAHPFYPEIWSEKSGTSTTWLRFTFYLYPKIQAWLGESFYAMYPQ